MAPKWRFLSHPLQLLWFPPRLVPWVLLCSESLGFCGYCTRSGRRETKTAANHCRRGPPLPRSDCRPDCRAGGGFCCCWCRRGGKKTHIFAQFITENASLCQDRLVANIHSLGKVDKRDDAFCAGMVDPNRSRRDVPGASTGSKLRL